MRKQLKEQKVEQKCSCSSRERDARCACDTAIPLAEPVEEDIPSAEPAEEDSSMKLVPTTTTTTRNSSISIRSLEPANPHHNKQWQQQEGQKQQQ